VCVTGAVLLAIDRIPMRELVGAARQVKELGAAPAVATDARAGEGRP
jgi:hypothetical protein